MKQAVSRLNTADWTMNGPSAPMALISILNRRQLLSGMAATAALLAAKPLALTPVARADIANPQAIAMGAFEGLRRFLQASAHPHG